MPSSFKPHSIPEWPGRRAVLLVHGIGDASTSGISAFPIDALKAALGKSAGDLAIYTLNYDFIDDWAAAKTGLAAGIAVLKNAIAKKFGGSDLATTVAEYAGDVLWPVLSADIRLAVRDAFVAQAAQVMLDCGETALARGEDPLYYQVSIIAHSLGCFHAYETLSATVHTPEYHMRPRSDLTRLQTGILLASPVQLIRAVGDARDVVRAIGRSGRSQRRAANNVRPPILLRRRQSGSGGWIPARQKAGVGLYGARWATVHHRSANARRCRPGGSAPNGAQSRRSDRRARTRHRVAQ
jgi:hypothetical protein